VVSNDLIVGEDSDSGVGRMKEWSAEALFISSFLDVEVENVLTPRSRIVRLWHPQLVLL
jgi:hypothetical protein